MKIEYDQEADALYIQLRDGEVDDNIDIETGITLDLDHNRRIIGIEILDAQKVLSSDNIFNISFENLPIRKFESVGAFPSVS